MSDRKIPPAAEGVAKQQREQANSAGIARGLDDMNAGNTVPHEAAMAKVDAMPDEFKTAKFFEERAKRADYAAFDRFMNRAGGEPPRAGDELPEGYVRRG